jgi:hypothetical protein
MDNERNLGVTEARFALTLLTCLLVAIGYVVLLRLGGGAKETTVEPGPEDAIVETVPADPRNIEPKPRVLPLETADRAASPNSSANSGRR